MDKLKLMKSFVLVVRAGSFLSAARDMGASRSLLSKHISGLEEKLGIQLLNRDTHSMSLTESGTEYYRFCVQFLNELEEMEAAMMERADSPQGTLRIIAPLCFGARFLGPAIADFSDLYPELNVSVNLWGQPLQASDIVGHSYDIVIRTIAPVDSNLKVRKIAPVRNVVCATPDYLERYGEPRTPFDLSGHPCLYHRKVSDDRWHFRGPDRDLSVRLPAATAPRTNSVEILRDMALAGRGIGILADYAVCQDLASGRLREILPDYKAEERGLYLIFPDGNFRPLKVRLFVDFFVERFGAAPWAKLSAGKQKNPDRLMADPVG